MLSCAALACLPGCAPSGPPLCTAERLGQLTVELRGALPWVEAAINGQAVTLLLDTGATDTVLSPETVKRLGLSPDYRGDVTLTGAGGSSRNFPVRMDSLTLGGATLRDQRAAVAELSVRRRGRVDGLLGGAQLRQFDLDLDLPHRTVGLYSPQTCPDAVPPFPPPYGMVRLIPSPSALVYVPMELDGVPLTALVDTGASGFVLSPGTALRVGATPDMLAADRAIRVGTADPNGIEARLHRFRELRIGGRTFRDPLVMVGPQAGTVEAVAGGSFWARHRTFLAYQAGQLFVAAPPVGGRPP